MSSQLSPQARMRSYLQLVATGPELSKSLNQADAEDAMSVILDGETDPVRAGIFLIALRMKRETDDENIGVLNALDKRLQKSQAIAPQIISIADPFNGYLRGLPVTPFIPAVFAACGLPAYCHGLETVGPKYGITANKLLKAVGKEVDLSVADAAARLDQQEVGWAYVDQKQYLPELHDLVPLRDTMVKRCCISTLEVVLKPISGADKTHLLTGFVHKAYPPVYEALAKHAGYESAMIVRGVEGGCIPSLSQLSRYFGYNGEGDLALNKLVPGELGITNDVRAVPVPDTFENALGQSSFDNHSVINEVVEHCAGLGLDALSGKSGPALDSLIYAVAIGLHHVGFAESLSVGAEQARRVIKSGEAADRFANG